MISDDFKSLCDRYVSLSDKGIIATGQISYYLCLRLGRHLTADEKSYLESRLEN